MGAVATVVRAGVAGAVVTGDPAPGRVGKAAELPPVLAAPAAPDWLELGAEGCTWGQVSVWPGTNSTLWRGMADEGLKPGLPASDTELS